MKTSNKFDEFRLARKLDFLNRFIHSVLLITFIVGVNLFAIKFSIRWDITDNLKNSLSPESVAHIQNISSQVSVYVLMDENLKLPNGHYAKEDVIPLVEEYIHTIDRLGKDNFSIKFVDIYRDREQVLQLKNQFDFDRDNVILVGSETKRRVVSFDELFSKGSQNDEWMFKGEQVITGALLEVSDPVERNVYLTVGHGEMSLDDVDPERGLSEFSVYCSHHNINVDSIDLSRFDYVPEKADVLVIASPQAEFNDSDVEKLRYFLEKTNGSLIVFLEPFRQHNMGDLFYDWGVLSDDAVIIDPGQDYQTSSGNLILRRFAEHPITQTLIDSKLYVYSNRPRPVRLDPGTPRIAGVQRTALLATSETSWLEMGFREESIPVFSEGRDVRGPISVGVLSERRGGESLGLKLKGGKLLVYGDASILSNNLFRLYGNRVLVSNSINWCLQRSYLLSIPPQRIANYRLTISEADLNKLLIALLSLPAGFAVAGMIVRIFRR